MSRSVIFSATVAALVTVIVRWLLSQGAALPDVSLVSMSGACERINTVGLRATVFFGTFGVAVSLAILNRAIRSGFQITGQAATFRLRSLFVVILLIAVVLSLARLTIM